MSYIIIFSSRFLEYQKKKKTIIPTLLVEEKFNHQSEVQRSRAGLFLMKKVWGEAALLQARVCPKCLPLVHVLRVGCCPV